MKTFDVFIVQKGYMQVAANSIEEATHIAQHQFGDSVSWDEWWNVENIQENPSLDVNSCITEPAF